MSQDNTIIPVVKKNKIDLHFSLIFIFFVLESWIEGSSLE